MLNSVPKNLRMTSSTPARSNLRFSQGCELVIMYHRRASGPVDCITAKGSTALPSRLLILLPFLSSSNPLEMMLRKATESDTMVAMACRVKNQPRV